MATVRYLVDDVERAEAFYVEMLGFVLEQEMLPAFARIRRDDLTLWLAAAGGKEFLIEDPEGNPIRAVRGALMTGRRVVATTVARWVGVATAGTPVGRPLARWAGRTSPERVDSTDDAGPVRRSARGARIERLDGVRQR